MSVKPTKQPRIDYAADGWTARLRGVNILSGHSVLATVGRVVVLLMAMAFLGGGALPAQTANVRSYSMTVAGWSFDLIRWEARAVSEKLYADVTRPSSGIDEATSVELVVDYLQRADRIAVAEDEMDQLISQGESKTSPEFLALEQEVASLRVEQDKYRSTVEQVIERQIGAGLKEERFTLLGIPFPPVQFAFTEPPKKLVVSPRDRIEIVHSNMLAEDMPVSAMEEAEASINSGDRVRAYITNIGGLGAFPTMVVDDASLEWILSTVAHEWTHNYLAMNPLGWSYFKNQQMTTINETVADIVGDEIGANVGEWYYGIKSSKPKSAPTAELQPGLPLDELDEPAKETILHAGDMANDVTDFDFRAEMRATRLEVDRLLQQGRVQQAEDFMEQRRQFFVANGYPLRVLNQAYFAFHGSYGKSAASTSPIGPKLRELRSLTPDLHTFVSVVKRFNDASDLDAALTRWRS